MLQNAPQWRLLSVAEAKLARVIPQLVISPPACPFTETI